MSDQPPHTLNHLLPSMGSCAEEAGAMTGTGWRNVYERADGSQYVSASLHNSRENAWASAVYTAFLSPGDTPVGCWKITPKLKDPARV